MQDFELGVEGMSWGERGSKHIDDTEFISITLNKMEKIIIAFFFVGTVATYFLIDYFADFEGVWIMGLPRPIFGILFMATLTLVVSLIVLFAYVIYFDRKIKEVTK